MCDWRLAALVALGVPTLLHASDGAWSTSVTPPMVSFLVQVGVLLIATRAGSFASRRLNLPRGLGEMAAGMVVGPFLLGAIPLPGFPGGLVAAGQGFPVSIELYGLCSLAAVLLLFMVGLGTDLHLFLRYSLAGTVVGLGGVVVSFVLGDLTGVVLGHAVFGHPVGFLDPQSLFLGAIAMTTSVGITARILTERRRLGTPEGVTTLAGAALDDVMGLMGLTVVLAVASTTGAGNLAWGRLGALAVKAIGAWLAIAVVGLLVARRIGDLLKRFRGRAGGAVMILGLTLILAGLFEGVGSAMAIGAYVMGLTLSQTDYAHAIRKELEPLYAFLVPLFFGVMGMLVNLRDFGDTRVVAFGLAYALMAIFAKTAGCGLPALAFGFNLRGALRIGVGMVPRGEVAVIVAGVGLTAGILPPAVFGMAILMIAVTALCASPLLVGLCRDNRSGVRRSEVHESEEMIRFPFADSRQADWVIGSLQNTLRKDGFFVHALEREDGTVLALRARSSIAFRSDNTDVVFTCAPREVPVVKTAVLYVVRELRTALEAMRRPLDANRLFRDVSAEVATTDLSHDLKPFLRADLVKLRLKGASREAILREMVDMVRSAGLVEKAEDVLAAVMAREQSMSTGLERGIAVPHCRTDAVRRLVCAIGLAPAGVDFGALDGQPSRVFVLTLSPLSDPAPHVQFMSLVVQALTPTKCERLLKAESTHEAIAILSAWPEAEPAAADLADGPPTASAGPAAEAAPTVATAPRAESARNAEPSHAPVPHIARATALREAVMLPRLAADDKDGVIAELLAALSTNHVIADLPQVHRQLLQREQEMSTGLERGIAVPHCRCAGIDRVLCAVGLKPTGLDFGSQDGAPTQIVVLMLASTSMPTPYSQTLALLLQALNRVSRSELFACTDPQAMHAVILKGLDSGEVPRT